MCYVEFPTKGFSLSLRVILSTPEMELEKVLCLALLVVLGILISPPNAALRKMVSVKSPIVVSGKPKNSY